MRYLRTAILLAISSVMASAAPVTGWTLEVTETVSGHTYDTPIDPDYAHFQAAIAQTVETLTQTDLYFGSHGFPFPYSFFQKFVGGAIEPGILDPGPITTNAGPQCDNAGAAATPEPASSLLLGFGCVTLGMWKRGKSRAV